MNRLLRNETDGDVSLTLNRPEVRNAIDGGLMTALDDEIAGLAERDDLVAVILTGAGDTAFCAGGDLRWLQRFETPLDDPVGRPRWTPLDDPLDDPAGRPAVRDS